MNKLVVFDVDNTLCDFEGQLVEHVLMEKYGYNVAVRNREEYLFEKRWAEFQEVLMDALEFVGDPNSYYALESIASMIEFAGQLESKGAVMYLSARPRIVTPFTERWLRKHNLMYEEYSTSLYCGVDDKTEFLSDLVEKDGEFHVEFVVEDSPSQIKSLKEAGFSVLCFDRPWNEGIFPRIYENGKGGLMYWSRADEEAEHLYGAFAEMEA